MNMRSKIFQNSVLVLAVFMVGACTQTTPSMMNTNKIELAQETIVEQIPLADVNANLLAHLANQYRKHGNSAMDLVITYDPAAKDFTAMNAVHELGHIKQGLAANGVKNITAQTLAVLQGTPSLMVTFDSVRAQAPSNCAPMPGLESNETGRFIGDYKFGCGVESMMAKQIARPRDLMGNDNMDRRDARREASVLEGYASGQPRTPLEGIEREDLASE